MPEALVGGWVTEHPDYRGRTLVIGPSSVQIGRTSGAASLDGGPWPIEALSVRTVGDESAVSLAYRTSSGRVFLNAVLAHTAPPSLRLAQPDRVAWQRQTADPQATGTP
jgi:hypothetical protein